jgi:hypothetical protein
MFGHGKKMVQFYNNPNFGVGMSVWSKVIELHTKVNIINLVMGCKGCVK